MAVVFTGIIEATAEIVRNDKGKLTVQRPASFIDLRRGSSVCVAGACLTVTMLTKKEMTFDVVPETLARTTLGSKKPSDRVNLERAMRADGRFDGHVVQGHVEGIGMVTAVSDQRSVISVKLEAGLMRSVVAKGSIVLDGVSLTVADAADEVLSVALIPATLRETTLGSLTEGDRVNIETDILGRYVRQFLSSRP